MVIRQESNMLVLSLAMAMAVCGASSAHAQYGRHQVGAETPNSGFHVPQTTQPQNNWIRETEKAIIRGLNDGWRYRNQNEEQPYWRPNYQPPRPNNYYVQPQPSYNQPPQPTYYQQAQPTHNQPPSPPPQTAAAKKNMPPRAKPKSTVTKKNPIGHGDPPSQALLNSTQEQIAVAETTKIDEFVDGLNNVDPRLVDANVQNQIAMLKTKIAAGQPVTQADFDKLTTAVHDAQAKLPNPLVVNQLADMTKVLHDTQVAVLELSKLSEQLNPVPGTSGGGGGLVIFNPALPPGTVYVLPSGAIMTGGGGDTTLTMQQGSLVQVLGLPASDAPPLPDVSSQATAPVDSGTVILNPTDSIVHYMLNGQHEYTMKPGESQALPADQNWVIRFDRGGTEFGATGEAAYTLSEGSYCFGTKGGGWEIFPQSFEVVLDNHDNPGTFEYILDNVNYTVAAKATRTHTSRYPMFIVFDRGGNDGANGTKKIIERTIALHVAVDANDQLWNLFPIDDPSASLAAE